MCFHAFLNDDLNEDDFVIGQLNRHFTNHYLAFVTIRDVIVYTAMKVALLGIM